MLRLYKPASLMKQIKVPAVIFFQTCKPKWRKISELRSVRVYFVAHFASEVGVAHLHAQTVWEGCCIDALTKNLVDHITCMPQFLTRKFTFFFTCNSCKIFVYSNHYTQSFSQSVSQNIIDSLKGYVIKEPITMRKNIGNHV